MASGASVAKVGINAGKIILAHILATVVVAGDDQHWYARVLETTELRCHILMTCKVAILGKVARDKNQFGELLVIVNIWFDVVLKNLGTAVNELALTGFKL